MRVKCELHSKSDRLRHSAFRTLIGIFSLFIALAATSAFSQDNQEPLDDRDRLIYQELLTWDEGSFQTAREVDRFQRHFPQFVRRHPIRVFRSRPIPFGFRSHDFSESTCLEQFRLMDSPPSTIQIRLNESGENALDGHVMISINRENPDLRFRSLHEEVRTESRNLRLRWIGGLDPEEHPRILLDLEGILMPVMAQESYAYVFNGELRIVYPSLELIELPQPQTLCVLRHPIIGVPIQIVRSKEASEKDPLSAEPTPEAEPTPSPTPDLEEPLPSEPAPEEEMTPIEEEESVVEEPVAEQPEVIDEESTDSESEPSEQPEQPANKATTELPEMGESSEKTVDAGFVNDPNEIIDLGPKNNGGCNTHPKTNGPLALALLLLLIGIPRIKTK